jgi:hypothetical protein
VKDKFYPPTPSLDLTVLGLHDTSPLELEQVQPWSNTGGAIRYLRNSQEDLFVAKSTVTAAHDSFDQTQQANVTNQGALLAGPPGERAEARESLEAARQRVGDAELHLEFLRALRIRAENEARGFYRDLGQLAMSQRVQA